MVDDGPRKAKSGAKARAEVALEAGVGPDDILAWRRHEDGRLVVVTTAGRKITIADGERVVA
ncbi:MAG: hypothetical protein OHK0024_24340 [Thalassobaculales bacterium]